MAINALLVGRLHIVVDDAKGELPMPNLEIYSATNLTQADAIFKAHSIDHVFMGARITLEQRLEIARVAFQYG